MAIKGYFFNAEESGGVYDRAYNAEDMTSYLDGIVGNGVFMNPSNSLQVVPKSGRTITVKAGMGWINGHKIVLDADMDLTVDAISGLGRTDSVVFAVDADDREMKIYIKKGNAGSDNPPSLTRTDSLYEMGLANVKAVASAGTITQIDDTRMNSSRCGVVQGLIQQASTTSLFEAWQTAFETWFASVKSAFIAGSFLKKLEGVVTAAEPMSRVNVVEYIPTFNPFVDVLEVYINGIHLNANQYSINDSYVNFIAAVKAGDVVDLVVYRLSND